MTTALADQLAAARRRSFVGRRDEVALFEALLAKPGTGGVVYLHGPGGVGKSTLLRQVAWLGEQSGRRVLWFDARDAIDPGADGMLAGLAQALGGLPTGAVLETLAKTAGLLLLVDTAELLIPLDRWLRDDLLAALPADAVAVLAGREPAPLAWRVDPGWRGVLQTIALTNLAPAESGEMLTALGVPASEHAAALAFTHGHPLALALVADVCAQKPGPFALKANPQAVSALLAGLLDAVPSSRHRGALEACAQVRVTTEPLLAALLDVPDARELFDWLCGLSTMEYGQRGVYPHEVARDALAAELRWRHPARYTEIHRRAGGYYQHQFRGADPLAQQSVLRDLAYLHRDNAVFGPLAHALSPGSAGGGDLVVAPPRATDWAVVRELIERHEGAASATIAEHWFARQPEALAVVRTPDGVVAGCCLVLRLESVDDADRRVDPGVDSARSYLDRNAPLRAEESATLLRFWLDAEEYQGLSATATAISMHLARIYLTNPQIAVSLQCYADPEYWAPLLAYVDFTRVAESDFSVGGRGYGGYGHDWRVVPPVAWLELLGARETAEQPLEIASAAAGVAPVRVLDAEEFAGAVRAALYDLERPDRLRGCALVRSRLVSARAGTDTSPAGRAQAIADVIREGAAVLEASVRDRRGYRALHHTYLQPAGSQQRAADLLKLPMSTFRRHLAAGIERLTEILWERELAGNR